VIKLLKFLSRHCPRGTEGLARDTRGGVFILMAVGLLMLATATAVGVDFARSANFKSALQGAVDTAAIAGASVYLNNGYGTEATTAAANYLNNATPNLPKNNGITSTVTVSASAPWTVTVNAKSSINTSFGALLEKSVAISTSATAHGPTNPNIDFSLLLDNSPSMAIAATQAGINSMVNLTQNAASGYTSCGFGCHEQNTSSGIYSGTTQIDLYQLARNNNITLRIDNVRTATQNLMTTAQTTAAANSASYRAAIYTFNNTANTITNAPNAIQTLTSNMTTAYNSAAKIAVLETYDQSYLTSSNYTDDTDTDIGNAMNTLNTNVLPNPGYGTKAQGDTPQEVLMLVTDGVEDKIVSTCTSGANCVGTSNVSSANGGLRQQYMLDTSQCTAIKNRGIRIAVLYTVYYPLPTNAWYNTYVSPFESNIGTTLESCASPGLYFAVSTGGDISAAMTALFTSAVQSSYISN
jgi:Flp pilus assembly protein TadG